VLCLLLAVVALLGTTRMVFTAGDTSATVDCGSPAFPNELIDLRDADAAANCAGQTSASVALYAVLLAGLGLGAIAITSRGTSKESAGL
jgi:hypothetical protein